MRSERRAVSVGEAAVILGISRAHCYRLIGRGDLPSIWLGRRILVPLAPLFAMLGAAGEHLASGTGAG